MEIKKAQDKIKEFDSARGWEDNWNIKNPQTKVWGVSWFLNTSKIKFALSRTEVGSLRKLNFLSIKKEITLSNAHKIGLK